MAKPNHILEINNPEKVWDNANEDVPTKAINKNIEITFLGPNLSKRYPQENPIILCVKIKITQYIVLKALIVVTNYWRIHNDYGTTINTRK